MTSKRSKYIERTHMKRPPEECRDHQSSAISVQYHILPDSGMLVQYHNNFPRGNLKKTSNEKAQDFNIRSGTREQKYFQPSVRQKMSACDKNIFFIYIYIHIPGCILIISERSKNFTNFSPTVLVPAILCNEE